MNMISLFSLDYVMESNYRDVAYRLFHFIQEKRKDEFSSSLNKCEQHEGDKICERMKIIKTARYKSCFGRNEITKAVVSFVSSEENVHYVCFTTAKEFYSLREGDEAIISGTIGKTEYDNYMRHDKTRLQKPKVEKLYKSNVEEVCSETFEHNEKQLELF